MIVQVLLEKLRKEGYQFNYTGPLQKEIYAVQMISDRFCVTESEILYIPTFAISGEELGSGASILSPHDNESSDRILTTIQKWMIDDIRRKHSLVKLQQDILDGHNIYDIGRRCSEIMQSPVLLVNRALSIVCQYPKSNSDKEFSTYVTKSVGKWRDSQENSGTGIQTYKGIARLFYKNKEYYICVMDEENRINHVCDMEYLQRICAIFNACIQKAKGNERTQRQKILTGLLLKEIVSLEKEQLELLEWERYEKHYVLAVEKKYPAKEDEYICRDLGSILETETYDLGNYYVALLHSERYVEYTEQSFPELNRYLKKHDLWGMLSMGFAAPAFLAVRFEQCKSSLEIGLLRNEKSPGLRYYARYQISHLVDTLTKNQQIDLREFCNPVILYIYETDKEKNTEYLSTLFVYICSGQSMKASADAMKIHVNTMYMRVNKLKDEFKIDFNDIHMLYAYHNSIVFMHIYDYSCMKNGYPYLK